MLEVESVLVTGANKGIGLEFVKQFVNLTKPPRYVFATYRSRNTIQDLENIGKASKQSKIILIKMDVTSTEDITAARKVIEETVGDKGLTLLINNAGAAQALPFPKITEENLLFHFKTNTIAPVMIFQEMLPLLKIAASLREGTKMSVSRAAVLNISSMVGSIENVKIRPSEWMVVASYATSKAALNMVMRMSGNVAKEEGILVVNMCPGFVKTDINGRIGELEPPESISNILDTLSRLDDSHHGTYIDRKGMAIPF